MTTVIHAIPAQPPAEHVEHKEPEGRLRHFCLGCDAEFTTYHAFTQHTCPVVRYHSLREDQ